MATNNFSSLFLFNEDEPAPNIEMKGMCLPQSYLACPLVVSLLDLVALLSAVADEDLNQKLRVGGDAGECLG